MKNNKKKGFTLMELLIVIAIIVVLVAIAIPVFGGQLTKAKETTDIANIRSAYAEVQTDVATGGTYANEEAVFNAIKGKVTLQSTKSNVLTYDSTNKKMVYDGDKVDASWKLSTLSSQ